MNEDILVKKASRLEGEVKAPPSKSYTHRAIMLGSLNGGCKIINPLFSDDTRATINILRELGATVNEGPDRLQVVGVQGEPSPRTSAIDVGESGTLLRFILPILALTKGNFRIDGKGTLRTRSNKSIVKALQAWGIKVKGRGEDHELPIELEAKGKIQGGLVSINGQQSSQVVSALLITASFAEEDIRIRMQDGRLVSKPYVDVTIDVLRKGGIKVEKEGYREFFVERGQELKLGENFVIHGDYSSAAFLMAAACLTPSDITITDLEEDQQGDREIINILRNMGATIENSNKSVRIKGPFELKGVDIDCGDTPDLVPILTTLGCFAEGQTIIQNIAHVVHKESNRIKAPAEELRKLGAKISTTRDSITVSPSPLTPAEVSSQNDHRIAMALTVAGLIIGDVKVRGVDCINKSYPNFRDDIKFLGAKFTSL